MAVDASRLTIVHYPDPALRRVARPIPEVTDEVGEVAARMIDLMHEAEGIGLAAPQVGLSWRLFVADVPADEGRSPTTDPPTATDGAIVYINPVLSEPRDGIEPYEEGCLSLPDIRGEVFRPPAITITALDVHGRRFTHSASGLLARCWQHEMDHLDGVLIIDRMSQSSRMKVRALVRDLERQADHR
ncbi:MAG: peptide deformylase [Phycisphaerales bacterium]|nr:peptide deformylase [Phycisphaerales bacterium]